MGQPLASIIRKPEMLRSSIQRIAVRSQSTVTKTAPRALSNAYVGSLETRWETLPKEDQTRITEELKARMELPWQELTTAKRKPLTTSLSVNGVLESLCTRLVMPLRYSGEPLPVLWLVLVCSV